MLLSGAIVRNHLPECGLAAARRGVPRQVILIRLLRHRGAAVLPRLPVADQAVAAAAVAAAAVQAIGVGKSCLIKEESTDI